MVNKKISIVILLVLSGILYGCNNPSTTSTSSSKDSINNNLVNNNTTVNKDNELDKKNIVHKDVITKNKKQEQEKKRQEEEKIKTINSKIGLTNIKKEIVTEFNQIKGIKGENIDNLINKIVENEKIKNNKTGNLIKDNLIKEFVKKQLINEKNKSLKKLKKTFDNLKELEKQTIYLVKDDIDQAYKENMLKNITLDKQKILEELKQNNINMLQKRITEQLAILKNIREKAPEVILNPNKEINKTIDALTKISVTSNFKKENNFKKKIINFVNEKIKKYKNIKINENNYKLFLNICSSIKNKNNIYLYDDITYVLYNNSLYKNILPLCKLNLFTQKEGIKLPLLFRKTNEKIGGVQVYEVGGPLIKGVKNTITLKYIVSYKPELLELHNPFDNDPALGNKEQDILNSYLGF